MWTCPLCHREFKHKNQDHYCLPSPDVDEYIQKQPEAVQGVLHSLRQTIRKAAPEAREKIAWQMPTYWQGENLIHFAAFKNHIDIYPGGEATHHFADRLKAYKTGKGSIQFPLDQAMDLNLIKDLVYWRLEQIHAKDKMLNSKGDKKMTNERVYKMAFAKVYPLLVNKAERKGRSKEEVDEIIRWLTGYDQKTLEEQIQAEVDYETFFAQAPQLNPNVDLIKGVVCGIRVENIEDPLMQKVRWLDKLIDELARGKAMEKILRK